MEVETVPPGTTTTPYDDPLDRAFNRIIDNFFQGNLSHFCPAERAWNPPTDVYETADAIHIKMEVAGLKDEDIEVKVADNLLIIRGRRRDDSATKKENFHLMEIHYGSFERVFGLPAPMEVGSVTASLEAGFLHVTIPKDKKLTEYRIDIDQITRHQ